MNQKNIEKHQTYVIIGQILKKNFFCICKIKRLKFSERRTFAQIPRRRTLPASNIKCEEDAKISSLLNKKKREIKQSQFY